MSGQHPPLSYADVVRVLKHLGFVLRPTTATSHEQWARLEGGRLLKVTVDKSKAPYTRDLVTWMARQAGMTKAQFYAVWRSIK
jgi:predicted RNA binding protein YcfA (HicA-like mRNA interferase family)